jgi:hypothetical protein
MQYKNVNQVRKMSLGLVTSPNNKRSVGTRTFKPMYPRATNSSAIKRIGRLLTHHGVPWGQHNFLPGFIDPYKVPWSQILGHNHLINKSVGLITGTEIEKGAEKLTVRTIHQSSQSSHPFPQFLPMNSRPCNELGCPAHPNEPQISPWHVSWMIR